MYRVFFSVHCRTHRARCSRILVSHIHITHSENIHQKTFSKQWDGVEDKSTSLWPSALLNPQPSQRSHLMWIVTFNVKKDFDKQLVGHKLWHVTRWDGMGWDILSALVLDIRNKWMQPWDRVWHLTETETSLVSSWPPSANDFFGQRLGGKKSKF